MEAKLGLVGSSLPLNLGTLGLMCLPKYGKGCLSCELATHPSVLSPAEEYYEYIRVSCIVFAIIATTYYDFSALL